MHPVNSVSRLTGSPHELERASPPTAKRGCYDSSGDRTPVASLPSASGSLEERLSALQAGQRALSEESGKLPEKLDALIKQVQAWQKRQKTAAPAPSVSLPTTTTSAATTSAKPGPLLAKTRERREMQKTVTTPTTTQQALFSRPPGTVDPHDVQPKTPSRPSKARKSPLESSQSSQHEVRHYLPTPMPSQQVPPQPSPVVKTRLVLPPPAPTLITPGQQAIPQPSPVVKTRLVLPPPAPTLITPGQQAIPQPYPVVKTPVMIPPPVPTLITPGQQVIAESSSVVETPVSSSDEEVEQLFKQAKQNFDDCAENSVILADLDRILGIKPGHLQVRLLRASVFLSEERYEEARKEASLLLARAPMQSDIYHKAVEVVQKAAEFLNPQQRG